MNKILWVYHINTFPDNTYRNKIFVIFMELLARETELSEYLFYLFRSYTLLTGDSSAMIWWKLVVRWYVTFNLAIVSTFVCQREVLKFSIGRGLLIGNVNCSLNRREPSWRLNYIHFLWITFSSTLKEGICFILHTRRGSEGFLLLFFFTYIVKDS